VSHRNNERRFLEARSEKLPAGRFIERNLGIEMDYVKRSARLSLQVAEWNPQGESIRGLGLGTSCKEETSRMKNASIESSRREKSSFSSCSTTLLV
jgi:hypothetical protein